jgi:hypothetical protein
MEAITVALITVFGGIAVALIQKGRKENNQDHARVGQALGRIETKIDGHINDHAKGDV